MQFKVEFWKSEKYLPTKRHRNPRERFVECSTDVEVEEMVKDKFPVAFIIHDYHSVYPDAESCFDFKGKNTYEMFSEEIRTYNGNLYTPVRISYGTAISLHYEPLDYIRNQLESSIYNPWEKYGKDFTEKSIILSDTEKSLIKEIRKQALKYVIYEGHVWKTCKEPMYSINTFGLGHNHGGTGFFIDDSYNSNIGRNNYFNALERDQAIAYGKKIALGRGDTKSVDGMGEHDIIEVLMPEMVKRNPHEEHGDGNEFTNMLEDMINKTDSSTEAGILLMAMTMAGLNKK